MAPQEGEPVGIAPGHRQEGAGPQPTPTRFGQLAAQLLAELLEYLLEDLAVELLLRPEVPVDDEFRDAARGRHLLHRCVGEARRRKGTCGPLQDGGTPF